MGRQNIQPDLSPEGIRTFTKALLDDLRALEQVLERGMIDRSCHRIGAEQELFLVDSSWQPAPKALDVLERLHQDRFATELAQFNLEINLDPLRIADDCFAVLEQRLSEHLEAVRAAARSVGADVVLTGILPTLNKTDLAIDNITPYPRYHALNEATNRLRGGPYRLRIEGADDLHVEHDSVMLEACNTSFQVHLQVSHEEFARLYNVAQLALAPVLAAAVNSPLLFGKRLWEETRVALFKQSVDTRGPSPHVRDIAPRVRFGERWIAKSVVEAFQEDVARFPVLLATPITERPFEELAAGRPPELQALQTHNTTVYSWNRPCYGVRDGQAHLRIECRVLPAGPSVLDEVANAAFWTGLVLGAAREYGDVTSRIDFHQARDNFFAAARYGLRAGFTWFDGASVSAPELIGEQLLELAAEGLRHEGVRESDIGRYLGVIERRVASGRTGAAWTLRSLGRMKDRGTPAERLAALSGATATRQASGSPVHEWELAELHEAGGWSGTHLRVEQYMTTELFTVSEDELVDRVAFLMDRKQLRHVLIEDHHHNLVGIVSYRSLIRLLARGGQAAGGTIPVTHIMSRDPITISPATSSLDAIELMRVNRVSALPVIHGGKLVGLITEGSFMDVAHGLLTEKLGKAARARETSDPA